MPLIHLQETLRESARAAYQAVALPPFTLFFHATDPLPYYNYAIPDRPCGDGLDEVLRTLRRQFLERGRIPRLEFFEEFAPELPAALLQNHFIEEARQWGMICTSGTALALPALEGLTTSTLRQDASLQEVRDVMRVQRAAFEPDAPPEPSTEEIYAKQARFASGQTIALLARLNGEAVAAANLNPPLLTVTELTGVATLPAYRRRGIAAFITAQALQTAFGMGVSAVYLTAADEAAGRVYQRAGFRPCSIMLAFRARPE